MRSYAVVQPPADVERRHVCCSQLPADIGLLKKLWNLDIQGCRCREHLQLLLGDKARRTAEVLGYLKSIKEEYVALVTSPNLLRCIH